MVEMQKIWCFYIWTKGSTSTALLLLCTVEEILWLFPWWIMQTVVMQ